MTDAAARFDLTDRVAIVSGGTRGIGYAIAEGLAAAGAKVAVASRKVDACDAAAARLRALGTEAIGVPAHVGDLDAVASLVAATVDAFGGIDIVVNSAANPIALPIGQISREAWTKSFDVNVRGPVFLVQAALPYLEASPHAAILNVVSGAAFLFTVNMSLYAAGKAALVSFTRSMAAELVERGIRVNALSPGIVDTDMMRAATPEALDDSIGLQLISRMADVEEMVAPALLLVSDAGSFITGQVLFADGGTVPR
jgi:NAD(P)-dependent dehydrogenase (short-subunit alcohol dehydrogenase family)